ncbi:hypothetical protein T440DRAFT_102792 [Plenodomus tracheiphilus IPT5]|uniref:Uncharacterized protein n=1 Tax=Plenodomus tracheiphilus IPT5 TaxID=1408161 RepID=A0A6A7BP72_9PLEO|nr:hypothetical protein T440DRAFT_102792 [Plenodomus tracheiphilus IPT5]
MTANGDWQQPLLCRKEKSANKHPSEEGHKSIGRGLTCFCGGTGASLPGFQDPRLRPRKPAASFLLLRPTCPALADAYWDAVMRPTSWRVLNARAGIENGKGCWGGRCAARYEVRRTCRGLSFLSGWVTYLMCGSQPHPYIHSVDSLDILFSPDNNCASRRISPPDGSGAPGRKFSCARAVYG